MIFKTKEKDKVKFELYEPMQGVWEFMAGIDGDIIFNLDITEEQRLQLIKQMKMQGILELIDVPF